MAAEPRQPRSAYTAFGEMVVADGTIGSGGTGVSPVGSRYQYADDSGYESGRLPATSQPAGENPPLLRSRQKNKPISENLLDCRD